MATPVITGIDVSYGSALLATQFRRLVNRAGVPVNIQPVPGAIPVNIWVKAVENEAAVVDVAILHDDEPAPPGFRKVARDLAAGATASKAYLAYKLTASEDNNHAVGTADTKVIRSLAILAENEAPESPGTGLDS